MPLSRRTFATLFPTASGYRRLSERLFAHPLLLFLAFVLPVAVAAQSSISSTPSYTTAADTIGVKVYFRQGYSTLQPTFRNNGSRLDEFVGRVGEMHRDSSIRLNAIDILSYVSPEGSYSINKRLVRRRAANLTTYLRNKMPFLSDTLYNVQPQGIDWEGLAAMVEASDMRYRSEVLNILRNVPEKTYRNGILVDSRLKQLMDLRGGRPYNYMFEHFFPEMRSAGAYVVCNFERIAAHVSQPTDAPELPDHPDATEEADTILSLPAETVVLPRIESYKPTWIRHAYVKTNLPAWLCLWANIAGEIDIAPHWSANIAIYYSGWNYFKRSLKFRTTAIMPEVRYWLQECNDGFFVGAHPGLAYYNLALDGESRYQDHDGRTPAIGGGISIGFRFALPRNPRWKFEASVGGGIYHLDYDIFDNNANGLLVNRRHRTFYGLDNVSFSLCYSFDIIGKGGKTK